MGQAMIVGEHPASIGFGGTRVAADAINGSNAATAERASTDFLIPQIIPCELTDELRYSGAEAMSEKL